MLNTHKNTLYLRSQHWALINCIHVEYNDFGAGNGLVPSGNKPLPEPGVFKYLQIK